jgi:hypothetical protein
MQMTAAVAAFDADPESARRALLQARSSSKAALQELRATVALHRDPEPAAPVPTLDRVPELGEPARAACIEIAFHHEHGNRAGLVAYRATPPQ